MMIPFKWIICNIQGKNPVNYFFNIRGNVLNFGVFISRKAGKNSIKFLGGMADGTMDKRFC